MASETTNINIRMDKTLKDQADTLLSELGMNMTTAINIFLRQSVRQGKIPFEISLNRPPDSFSVNHFVDICFTSMIYYSRKGVNLNGAVDG